MQNRPLLHSIGQVLGALELLRILSLIRVRNALGAVHMRVARMIKEDKAEKEKRRLRFHAAIVLQTHIRQWLHRQKLKKYRRAIRAAAFTVREAHRRHLLLVRLRERYPPQQAIVLASFFMSLGYFPPDQQHS